MKFIYTFTTMSTNQRINDTKYLIDMVYDVCYRAYKVYSSDEFLKRSTLAHYNDFKIFIVKLITLYRHFKSYTSNETELEVVYGYLKRILLDMHTIDEKSKISPFESVRKIAGRHFANSVMLLLYSIYMNVKSIAELPGFKPLSENTQNFVIGSMEMYMNECGAKTLWPNFPNIPATDNFANSILGNADSYIYEYRMNLKKKESSYQWKAMGSWISNAVGSSQSISNYVAYH